MGAQNSGRWTAKLAALDANLLVALDALLQEGNVTRAAARIGVTQSAMSQTLGRLREHFDDPILTRVGRQMKATPFAQRISSRLHSAIGELEAVVRDRPVFDPTVASRRFVLATVDYLALLFIPALRRTLTERGSGLDLAVHALDAGNVAELLEAGVVDFYLGVHGATERSLRAKHLFEDPFALLVHSEHPLARQAPTIDAYASHPHVHVSPRREGGTVVGRALAAKGLERHVAVEVPFFSLLPGLLVNGDLVATVPRSLASLFAQQSDLTVLEPPVELPPLDICLAWDPRFEREPALAWLHQVVEKLVGEKLADAQFA
jgi:DNA-binding transcriptional LysR family regulator